MGEAALDLAAGTAAGGDERQAYVDWIMGRQELHCAPRRADGETGWYVAYTRVKAERRAAETLAREGFETFLPDGAFWLRRRHKRIEVRRLLFPRYMFVGFRPCCSWFDLRKADGVESVLANDGKPVAIAPALIEGMRAEQSGGAYNEREPVRLRAGDLVKFTRGAFEGMGGRCVDITGTRAKVVMELLKREVTVKIRVDELVGLS